VESRVRYKIIIRIEELNCSEIVNELKERGYEIESLIVVENAE